MRECVRQTLYSVTDRSRETGETASMLVWAVNPTEATAIASRGGDPDGDWESVETVPARTVSGQTIQRNALDSDDGSAPVCLDVKGFIEAVGENAERHGFHAVTGSALEYIAQIHSEVSEMVEELRDGHNIDEIYRVGAQPCGVPVELADVVLRCFDFAHVYNIDLERVLLEKHKFNLTRPMLHGCAF